MNEKIIAAVRNKEMFQNACESNVRIIFDLFSDIQQIERNVLFCKEHNKIVFIHIDLAEGIGKDKAGLKFIQEVGANGIISTRQSMIKSAREIGLKTVQRLFAIDSQSVDNVETLVKVKPNMIEIMPGIAYRPIKEISHKISVPIIAGGLVKTRTEIENALKSGAAAVSTGEQSLWNIK